MYPGALTWNQCTLSWKPSANFEKAHHLSYLCIVTQSLILNLGFSDLKLFPLLSLRQSAWVETLWVSPLKSLGIEGKFSIFREILSKFNM